MIAVLRSILCFILTFHMSLAPILGYVFHFGERAYFEDWSKDSVYSSDYAYEIEKDPDKDFVILNLADLQMYSDESMGEFGLFAYNTVKKLIDEAHPDLITLTGDNAWGMVALTSLVKVMDSFGIPWAAVMGNHDGQKTPSEFWCAHVLTQSKYCLFKFGPRDMGYGNYIINITENGKPVHTLFMMDTHNSIEEDGPNGAAGTGYDHLWENQIEWYKWALNGIAAEAGKTVESSVFFHIPCREYVDAWNAATDGNGNFVGEYAETSFGTKLEGVSCPPENNGFFGVAKELGSTHNIVCGHDHVNSFSILYDGIRLTYGLKTGKGGYWEPGYSGGTVFTISSDGGMLTKHIYIPEQTVTDDAPSFCDTIGAAFFSKTLN